MMFINSLDDDVYSYGIEIVPHSESGMAPMSSLPGVELLGFRELGINGLMGEGRGKWGQSTSNLIRGRTVRSQLEGAK
jgi:hypothetical protein